MHYCIYKHTALFELLLLVDQKIQPKCCLEAQPTTKNIPSLETLMYTVSNFRLGPLTTAGFSKGDSLVVSAENQPLIALALAWVDVVTEESISLVLDR